jgi:hypothetical protein
MLLNLDDDFVLDVEEVEEKRQGGNQTSDE